jgi:hypothetical protein
LAWFVFFLKIHGVGFHSREIVMFTAEEIQARLREKPFRPLRIVASEGLRFDIDHPDLVFVGRRDLMIGSPDPASPTIYDRVTRVALVHVVALEDLPSAASTSHNGPPA